MCCCWLSFLNPFSPPVGMPEEALKGFKVQSFAGNGVFFGSSHIGSKKEVNEMLKLAAEKNIKVSFEQAVTRSLKRFHTKWKKTRGYRKEKRQGRFTTDPQFFPHLPSSLGSRSCQWAIVLRLSRELRRTMLSTVSRNRRQSEWEKHIWRVPSIHSLSLAPS